jgi:hypothetical protein
MFMGCVNLWLTEIAGARDSRLMITAEAARRTQDGRRIYLCTAFHAAPAAERGLQWNWCGHLGTPFHDLACFTLRILTVLSVQTLALQNGLDDAEGRMSSQDKRNRRRTSRKAHPSHARLAPPRILWALPLGGLLLAAASQPSHGGLLFSV